MLDRLELVMAQIHVLDHQRDAVVEKVATDKAEQMIQQLVRLRGIGVQSATLLVREAFVRPFANGKALGAYAGLSPTPYSSGGTVREQGIGKAGNARLCTDAGRACLDLATVSATQRSRWLVPRPPWWCCTPHAQNHGRRPGAEALDRVVEVRDPGCHPRGSGTQADILRLEIGQAQSSSGPGLTDPRGRPDTSPAA